MRTNGLIGQRITRIVQTRRKTSAGVHMLVDYIELEDGTLLIPSCERTT